MSVKLYTLALGTKFLFNDMSYKLCGFEKSTGQARYMALGFDKVKLNPMIEVEVLKDLDL